MAVRVPIMRAPGATTPPSVNVFGLELANFLQCIIGNGEYWTVTANSNNPPTITNVMCVFWDTDNGYTIETPSNNNVFPAGTTPTVFAGQGIHDATGSTFTWGAGGVPAQSDGTWYIILEGAEDTDSTSVGKGIYSIGLNGGTAPTWDAEKRGWYFTSGTESGNRALASFVSSSGTVSDIKGLYNDLKLYNINAKEIQSGIFDGYISGLQISDSGLQIATAAMRVNLAGKLFDIAADTHTPSTAALTWYAIGLAESNGNLQVIAISGFDNWTISGNQLAAATIYDEDYGYCRDSVSGVWYRIIGVAITNSGNSGYDYIIPIETFPKTAVKAYISSATSLVSSSPTVIDFDTIIYDLLSEVTVGAAWKFEPIRAKNITLTGRVDTASIAWTSGKAVVGYVFDAASSITALSIWNAQASVTQAVTSCVSGSVATKPSDDINIRITQTSGGNINTLTGTAYTIQIIEI